ncbi:MAG TPA: DinB family protein, partial [Candidatus Acidoferrales bacterium]|nr:DinB family protein [Candidatus Acidoferrales bacterium]
MRATVSLTDADMARPWAWGPYDEEGLRFALLMTHHELRDLAVRLAALRGASPTQAARILAQYHQAYRDVSAVLATVPTAELDRPPAESEWAVREVCLHMLGAEYGFLGVCRFALDRRRAGNDAEPSDDEWSAFSKPRGEERKSALATLESGSVEEIRNAFATIHIRALRELGDITDEEVDARSWYWDGAMGLRFRLHRFEEHLRQHTIQLDKTLA